MRSYREKTRQRLMSATYARGQEAIDALFDSQNRPLASAPVAGDVQLFCHGCGASVKEIGVHKCRYCGSVLNAGASTTEAVAHTIYNHHKHAIDTGLLYGVHIPAVSYDR